MHNYHATHDTFPPGYISATQNNLSTGPETGPGWGWATMILDNLEQRPLYNAADFQPRDHRPRLADRSHGHPRRVPLPE